MGITPAVPLGGRGGGYVFLQVLEERDAGLAPFDDVVNQARQSLRDARAPELARVRAEKLRAELEAGDADVEMSINESYLRGSELSDAGRSIAVETKAFELPIGELSEPLPSDNGFVIMRVLERSGFDAADFSDEKESFEQQLLNERRSRIWGAFVANLQSRYDVQIDWQAIRSITG